MTEQDQKPAGAGETGAEEPREWLGLKQLTRYAAICERTLRTWIRSPVDPLPAVQVGKKILVRRADFDRWLERHQVKRVDLGGIVDQMVREILRSARR